MELATRLFSLAKLSKPDKTTTPKQERKLSVRQEIRVKITPKRTRKTSLSITLKLFPLALPLLNYEEPMTKDVAHKPITLFLNCWTMTIHFIILIIVKT